MAGPVYIEGMDEVLRSFDKYGKAVKLAAAKALQKGSLNIIADAQLNLRTNKSVVTGLLRQSGKVQKIDDYNLDVGFFDTTNKKGYAYYVEYGRRSGGVPAKSIFAAWAYKKYHLHDWSHAFAIATNMAKRIAEQGTRPHPFFMPAIEKNKSKLNEALQNAINAETR